MEELAERIHASLTSAPQFSRLAPADYTATRLKGLTNLVFRLDPVSDAARQATGGPIVLRIAGEGTESYIDREVEVHNARAAAAAGVSAEVLHADPQSGLMITRCLDGIVTMTPDLFTARPDAPARAGRAFRRLHASGETFRFRFELFAMIEDYLKVLGSKDIELPEGYHGVVEAAEPVRQALAAAPAALAPCHCDPLCENFLDDGSVMHIVDWEYSGMNDPMWDLGDLSVEAGFSAEQDRELIEAYCGGPASEDAVARMTVYKAMCDLLWTLWGLIQHADGNPADDFWAYATNRFVRCKALMAAPDFARHVAAIGRSP